MVHKAIAFLEEMYEIRIII